MAGSSALGFVKVVIVPLLVAVALYLSLTYAILPFYRRYRADISRYSQYAPLTSTLQSTTSIFSNYIPEALQPRSIRERLGDYFVRLVLPSLWAWKNRRGQGQEADPRDSISSDDQDGGLFDEESGERMVGFDMNQGCRGVDGRRQADGRLGIRDPGEGNAMNAVIRGVNSHQDDTSDRRLSRDLEEGFMDDSGSEASDQEVTVGRRRVSISAR